MGSSGEKKIHYCLILMATFNDLFQTAKVKWQSEETTTKLINRKPSHSVSHNNE